MTNQENVFRVVKAERDYQDSRWNESTTSTKGVHSVGEYVGFMRAYLAKADDALSFQGEPKASQDALHIIRKITAMGIACMEQNGAPERE